MNNRPTTKDLATAVRSGETATGNAYPGPLARRQVPYLVAGHSRASRNRYPK